MFIIYLFFCKCQEFFSSCMRFMRPHKALKNRLAVKVFWCVVVVVATQQECNTKLVTLLAALSLAQSKREQALTGAALAHLQSKKPCR